MNALKILLYIVLFIALFSLFNFWLNTHPPKYRSRETPESYGIEYEKIKFKTADGYTLAGWLVLGKKNAPTIIIGHGYPFDKGNILPVALFLYPDYNLFFFDFRSFGESEGNITTGGAREIEDFNAAVRYLKTRKDINQIFGAYGFSLSAFTFIAANNPDIRAIVADSGYASIHDIISRMYSYLGPFKAPFVWMTELYGRIFLGIDSKKYVAHVTVPTLLIHGGKDSQIPPQQSQKIYATNKEMAEIWIIPGIDHGMSYAANPKEYKQRVREFFKKHL
ncbi:MAG: CocE/NonD family hydrolase [Candidatus Woesearchaeota archaeon]